MADLADDIKIVVTKIITGINEQLKCKLVTNN